MSTKDGVQPRRYPEDGRSKAHNSESRDKRTNCSDKGSESNRSRDSESNQKTRLERKEERRRQRRKLKDQNIKASRKEGPAPTYVTYDFGKHATFIVEQRYEVKNIIGHGAYGTVCSAVDLKYDRPVAIKKLEHIFEHKSLARRALRELLFSRLLYHENILGVWRVMHPFSKEFNSSYIVSELMETDLASVIRSPQVLTNEHAQFFIYQVLRGVKYLHSADIIHRDLKPRNLLVNSNCDLKICDFGLARLDDPNTKDRVTMSSYVATRWYRAPEVILRNHRYSKSVDMWAVGCILAELLLRRPLFPGKDSLHQLKLIVQLLGPPKTTRGIRSRTVKEFVRHLKDVRPTSFHKKFPDASEDAIDLLRNLLCMEPGKRLTAEQALAHPYLSALHCTDDEPDCTSVRPHSFCFEMLNLQKEDYRLLILKEIVNHYARPNWKPKDSGAGGRPAFVFGQQKTQNQDAPKGDGKDGQPSEGVEGNGDRRRSI